MLARNFALVVVAVLASGSCSDRFKYVKVKATVPVGKTDGLSADEQEVEKALHTFADSPATAAYFGKFMSSAVLVVQDFDDLTFTLAVENGHTRLTRGTDPATHAQFVVPLRKRNCDALVKIVEDGRIDEEESYRIHHVTFVPVLRSMFQLDPLYNETVAKELALPNLIHMVLKNEKGFVYDNNKRPASATALNVDGQWLVFEGLYGDAGMRTEATLQQVVELTNLMFEPIDLKNRDAAIAQLKKVKDFLASITVFRRP